ncbi:hypothetical protein WR25_13188 [Diploscapter pachys]|uniref:Ground-like domain-containing protein n=1 Tax=Diploscapter pachys TaxID=2018661 RepID=A0A2A2KPV0_9BILA|nr:hypothetical protein WR25_13188 [Diploscapter pachys]
MWISMPQKETVLLFKFIPQKFMRRKRTVRLRFNFIDRFSNNLEGYRRQTRKADGEKCNDERLRKIIEQFADEDPTTSKRAIQKAAQDQIGGLFDVICSNHDFSYLANTQMYCEGGNDYVTCFAFLHSLVA